MQEYLGLSLAKKWPSRQQHKTALQKRPRVVGNQIPIIKVALYICLFFGCKKTFRYVARVESSPFYGCKASKCPSCTKYKNFLGYFSGRFENYHQILRIFSKIPPNLHIVRVWECVSYAHVWPWGLNSPRIRIKKEKKSMTCCLGKLHVCLLILFVFYQGKFCHRLLIF